MLDGIECASGALLWESLNKPKLPAGGARTSHCYPTMAEILGP